MELMLIGIGGAAGSITRFALGKAISNKVVSKFPFGTFWINISGAFLLGVVVSIGFSRNLSLLLGDGFLGAYTTFSTFMYEGFNLFNENEKLNAFMYILGSVIIGIIGFVFGVVIGKLIKHI